MRYYSEDTVRKIIRSVAHTALGQMDNFADSALAHQPSIELPDNHGRLIDADAFKASLLEWLMKFVTHPNFLEAKKVTEDFFRDIDEAPTVLEAT